MSDPTHPDGPDLPGAAGPAYPVDEEHDRIYLELVDPAGAIVAAVPFAAPVNRNPAASYQVQVSIVHVDGCSRVILRSPLPTY